MRHYSCSFSLNTKFKTQATNSHNKDRDHSRACLFNSNGGYHTTLWWAKVISSVDAIYISAVHGVLDKCAART